MMTCLRRSRATRKAAAGFTLIELLAAVTILMIIVWVMARIFSETDRAWNLGTGRANNNVEGRAALQMMTHDLQYAVADRLITFYMGENRDATVKPFGFDPIDELCCVSIQNDSSDGNRAVTEVHYYMTESTNATGQGSGKYQLQRGIYTSAVSSNLTATLHCYHNRNWWKPRSAGGAGRPQGSQVIAENVAGLAFYYPDPDDKGQMLRAGEDEYDSADPLNNDELPDYVDVLLEVLNDREAEQVAQMQETGLPDETIEEFVERNSRRYTTRVYFHNRHGYKDR